MNGETLYGRGTEFSTIFLFSLLTWWKKQKWSNFEQIWFFCVQTILMLSEKGFNNWKLILSNLNNPSIFELERVHCLKSEN